MRPTWSKIVSDLCEQLQENQDKLTLLQEIDKATLSADTTLDQLAETTLQSLKTLAKLSRAGFYIFSQDLLLPIVTTGTSSTSDLPSPVLGPALQAGDITLLRPTDGDGHFLSALGCQTALISPVFGEGRRPLGLLALESGQLPILGHLDTPEICELASAVSRQFSIAVNFKERLRFESIRWQIISEILDNDLRPGVGFTTIAQHIPEFLPMFEAILLDPLPAVQVILHRAGDPFMTIVATTGHEPVNTRVLIDHSVCGHLILDERESLNIDPRTDLVYRPYLGHEMRSEFALRLPLGEGVTAIINLETPQEHAFKEIHARYLLRGGKRLVPLLKGLYFRRDRTLMQQRAMLYALEQHLTHLTGVIRHALGGPFFFLRGAAETIIKRCEEAKLDLGADSAQLLSKIAELVGIFENLVKDVVGFSHNEVRSVRQMLAAARDLVYVEELRKRNVVQVDLHATQDYEVFCSLFMKELFRNIIDNSVYWLVQRLHDEPDHHGLLEIFLEQEKPAAPDEIDRAINRRVKVIFRDNGPGMADEDFRMIAERGFTRRKAGTGFGLFAGREYVTSLGGEMLFRNDPGKSFEVTVIIPANNPSLQLTREPAIGGFSD